MCAEEVPAFLNDALKFGICLGLDRMVELDRLLWDPQKDLKVVHIAGTNGKGSVSAFLLSGLCEKGLKTGIFTSPFLERFSERMRILDGKEGYARYLEDETFGEISQEDLDRLTEKVREACRTMVENGFEHPTEFELVTALCYLWFSENNVDVAVLETGLGGRLDSTNVFESPLCTVITSIGYDHCDRLGDTIDLITGEKAGIFKKNVPAFCAEPREMILGDEDRDMVRDTLIRRAKEISCPLTFVGTGSSAGVYGDGTMSFELEGYPGVFVTKLQGEHQIKNAALAAAVLRDVFHMDGERIIDAFSKTVWKGRAEIISADPFVIMDGGHNVQCSKSLSDLLNAVCGGAYKGKKFRAVMGVMRDKDYEGMIDIFRSYGPDLAEVYAVKVDNPRTLLPEELCKQLELMYNNKVKVLCFDDAKDGLRQAFNRSKTDKMPLLITGSLYLIGEVRKEALRCATTDSLLQD